MNKKHIGIKNGKLYLSRKLIVGFLILCSLIIAVLVLHYRGTQSSNSSARPLGVAPSGAESVPKDSDAAAEFMTQKIKEEHANKLTVIFYYDGYADQDTAVRDAEILKKTLEEVEPYKSLQDLFTYKIITSGSICEPRFDKLLCEPRHLVALTKLGIPHIKIVIMHQGEFISSLDASFGANSVMTISTNRNGLSQEASNKKLRTEFLSLFKQSLGAGSENGYIHGVLSCFYGNKESYKIDSGYKNCKDFKAKYPEFWKGGDL